MRSRGGLSLFERAWCWLWIPVKLSVELHVMVSGSAYVLYADSNENPILNSVALLFITQIDVAAYSFAATHSIKALLNGVPDVGKVSECTDKQHTTGLVSTLAQMLGPWVQLHFLFGVSCILLGVGVTAKQRTTTGGGYNTMQR